MADVPENAVPTVDPGSPAGGGGEDVVITDRQLYDHAIAPDAKPQQRGDTPAEDQPLLQPQQPTVARDEQGRFIPKPAAPQPQAPQQQQRPEDHRVPLTELLNTRERAQKAEAEAAQLRAAWAQLQQQAAAAQQPQQPQTIFDDPRAYLQQHVVAPLRQEMEMRSLREKDAMSREFANHQFGPQVLDQALADLAKVRYSPQGNVLYWSIMNSGHPYASLVQWHKQAQAQRQIGPDPEAWFRQKAQQLLDDPRFQAAAIERARAGQRQRNPGAANVSLPPSLSSIPAAAPRLDDVGDLSNESLYRFAIK